MDGSDAAEADAAFLARLQRRRDEMTSLVRGRPRVHTSGRIHPPSVHALAKRELAAELPRNTTVLKSQHQLDKQLQGNFVAYNTLVAASMHDGGQRRSAAIEPPRFDLFDATRRVEDGFGRLSHAAAASGPEIRLRPDVCAHRVRKGAGKRAGLALSCDGWGTPSSTLR